MTTAIKTYHFNGASYTLSQLQELLSIALIRHPLAIEHSNTEHQANATKILWLNLLITEIMGE